MYKHVILNLFFQYIAWEIFSHLQHKPINEVPIVIENMKIRRATMLPRDNNIIFTANILTDGNFEILESGSVVCTGSIKSPNDSEKMFTYISEEQLKFDQLPENCYMKKDDVYFLYKIFGYQYKDNFQGILETRGSIGKLKWNNIWTAFLDASIHYTGVLHIGKEDHLPESIGMILIDPVGHLKEAKSNNNEFTIKYDKITNIIQCGKIEIRDVKLMEVSKKKSLVKPKLETHQFIPYDFTKELTLHDCIHLVIQIVVENSNTISAINILEVDEISEETENERINDEQRRKILSVELEEVLSEYAIIKCIHDRIKQMMDSTEIKKYNLVIFHGQIQEKMLLKLKENQNTFILLENINSSSHNMIVENDYVFVSTFFHEGNIYSLIRLKQIIPENAKIVYITTKTFEWVNTLKQSMNSERVPVYLLSENEGNCGIIGLSTCMKYEEGGTLVRCVFITEELSEKFSLNSTFFRNQLEKGLNVNVLKNSRWGSYRFLPYERVGSIETNNCYALPMVPGNLSRIQMIEKSPHFRLVDMRHNESSAKVILKHWKNKKNNRFFGFQRPQKDSLYLLRWCELQRCSNC